MADEKKLKVAVREGGGPPPGYQWTVVILDVAYREARRTLTNEAQYEHMALQVKELAREDEPARSRVVSIDKVEDFYELRDKGGVLGGINVRLFFGLDDSERSIVVLGLIKKQNDGPTPLGDKVRMRRRWRKYKKGELGRP